MCEDVTLKFTTVRLWSPGEYTFRSLRTAPDLLGRCSQYLLLYAGAPACTDHKFRVLVMGMLVLPGYTRKPQQS